MSLENGKQEQKLKHVNLKQNQVWLPIFNILNNFIYTKCLKNSNQ
jgi:hypothetical protein